jgi:hypothetical protein
MQIGRYATVGKLGRKISCDFNKDVKCILLIKGYKRCVFEETNEKQREKGEQQLGVCALLPQSERDEVLAAIKKEGISNLRSWQE